MIAARTLKKNITEIDCATSSSSAEITGAVAAIAEPPQIEDPTPINVEIFDGIFIILHSIKATARDVQIVEQIIGSDCMPVFATTAKSSPNPSRITAHCRTFFDVNLIPTSKAVLSLTKRVTIIPIIIANTGPPTIGKSLPRKKEGIAMTSENKIPFAFFLMNSIK